MVGRDTPALASLALEIRRLEEKVRQKDDAIVFAMSALLDLKDMHTGTHGTRLAEWAVRIGHRVGLDENALRNLEIASLLHDIGKVGVPESILNKPGRLTADEYELVKRHAEYGAAVLRLIPGFEQVSLLVLHHHERMDGSGYPAGLRGDSIPMAARIVAVLDAFDAMISTRGYRCPLDPDGACRELVACSDSQFDSRVVSLFIEIAADELRDVAGLSSLDPPSIIDLGLVC